MAIREFGDPDPTRLSAMRLPRPEPAGSEVLVRVVAAGVNPVDWKICRGYLKEFLPHRFPLVPGWDVAGVVEDIGDGASRFRRGDRVWAYARKPEVQWGCYAEYVALPEGHLAPMPARLLFEEAAAVPLAALTAYQCLFEIARVGPGTQLVVHGAGGGVGHFAVQLARRAGATVYGTAGPEKQAFVSSLGATAIDYTREEFGDALRRLSPQGVDVVLDTVGGDTLARSFAVLRPSGTLISIVEDPDPALAERHGVRACSMFVEPNGEQLRELAARVDRQELRPHVQHIYPLAQAAQALRVSIAGHVQGKLVLAL
jgi:NADPH2:quinone reductase